jgi:hypothetical protein
MAERSWKLKPSTKLGGWSVGLAVVMPILFAIGSALTDTLYESVQSGSTILADISGRPFLALSMLTGMAAGVSSFITGLLAIIRQKEKALLVYLSTVIGGILTLYLIAEFAFPH